MSSHTDYVGLDDATIELMNEIDQVGEAVNNLVKKLDDHPTIDRRWLGIGRTQLQLGGMALTRSVAKPNFFF